MTNRLRLHIENLHTQSPVFHLTPERYRQVAARHPECASRVDVSFGWNGDVYASAIAEADALVGWRFDHQGLAASAPRLRWVHLTGAGVEHLMPLDWLPAGATLTNNRGVHADKAGEYAAMAVLALNTRLPMYASQQQAGRWRQVFVSGIAGKTIVIVGVGHLGAAAARRCKALGMHVIGVRASGGPLDDVDEMITPAHLHTVLPRADVLLLSVPLTPATRQLIARRELDLLRPDCGVVNIARAAVMDYDVLFDKLRRGELSGAILDVFSVEPLPPDSPVWQVPNLIVTPHVSCDDADSYALDTLELVFGNLRRLIADEPLCNRVDPARRY